MRASAFAGAVVCGALTLSACTADFAKQGEGQLILVIVDITGEPGGPATEAGDVLLSDVSPVFNDDAVLTFNIIPKNPRPDAIVREVVFMDRYEVRYFRTDGRNVEGVDVPHRISGPLGVSFTFPTVQAAVVINVVRHQAKLEPPLRQLQGLFVTPPANGGVLQISGAGILTTIAEITLYGRTLNGAGISATGRIQVTFADFSDE